MNDLNLPEFIEYHEDRLSDLIEIMAFLEVYGKNELADKLEGVRDHIIELRNYYLENNWVEL